MIDLKIEHTLKIPKIPKIINLGNIECTSMTLSHVETKNSNESFLFSTLVESNQKCDRLMLFQVNKKNLKKFFNFELSVQDLIRKNVFVYFVDRTDEESENLMHFVFSENTPLEYFKEEDGVFLASFKGTEYEKELMELLKIS